MKIKLPFRKISDDFLYQISPQVLLNTERILREYGAKTPSNEGIVYWAGVREGNVSKVLLVVAPRAESDYGCITVSTDENFHFVKALNSKDMVQIAQVHTHPSRWVEHSPWDDLHAAFKVKGLLSLVVPSYCRQGMRPLKKCGVHRFDGKTFIRLSDQYIQKHFEICPDLPSELKDLR